MPTVPQIKRVSHIHFAISRGVTFEGIFEFRGTQYRVSMANGEPRAEKINPDRSCVSTMLGNVFSGPKSAREPDPVAHELELSAKIGLAIKDEGKGVELERSSLEEFMKSGWNLSGVDLSGCDFSRMKLNTVEPVYAKRAILKNVTAVHTGFGGWDFSESTIEGCTLDHASFARAAFQKAKFRNCSMEVAGFSGADCSESEIIDCNLHRADFDGADLRDAKIEGCAARSLPLRKANLTKARFLRFNVPTPPPFLKDHPLKRGVVSDWVLMNGATLDNTVFEDSDLSGMMFIHTNLRSVKFINTHTAHCTMHGDPQAFEFDAASLASFLTGQRPDIVVPEPGSAGSSALLENTALQV